MLLILLVLQQIRWRTDESHHAVVACAGLDLICQRVLVGKQLGSQRGGDYTHIVFHDIILLAEEPADHHLRLAELEEEGGGAVDRTVFFHELVKRNILAANFFRQHPHHAGHGVGDANGVLVFHAVLGHEPRALALHFLLGGFHAGDDHVDRAEFLDFLLGLLFLALANGQHRDHRAHAEDDAQHREHRAQRIEHEAPDSLDDGAKYPHVICAS